MKILIIGDVFRPSSFANVNIHLAYYLNKMGHDVLVRSKFNISGSFEDMCKKHIPHLSDASSILKNKIFDETNESNIINDKFDVAIYFLVDPERHNIKYKADKNIFYTVWSHNNYPQYWANACYKWNEIWCPSRANRSAIINAGVNEQKVKVVPHGYEPGLFNKNGRRRNEIMRFGMCNSICNFKGADIAIEAFIESFEPKDKVELYIMTTAFQRESDNNNDKHGKYYEEYIKILNKYNKQVQTYFVSKDSTLSEMAEFYKSCDCILSPHRGDGFGLVGLESMACGTPVIMSYYHGPKDYAISEYPFWIMGQLDWTSKPSKKHHFPDGGDPNEVYSYFEPDKEHLKYLINMAYNDWAKHSVLDTHKYLRGKTWSQVAEQISNILKGE